MKNTLEGINSRLYDTEEWISELEDRMVEITATKLNKEKRMKRNKDSLRDLWDNIKWNNIHIIGVPEGEEREKGPEKIFEDIIAEKFHNMRKETVNQVQEVQRFQVIVEHYNTDESQDNYLEWKKPDKKNTHCHSTYITKL